MDATNNDAELQILSSRAATSSSQVVRPSSPPAPAVETSNASASLSGTTQVSTPVIESGPSRASFQDIPDNSGRSSILRKLRKWKFYERIFTLPNVSMGIVTFVVTYRGLAYLYYQNLALFRTDCMARLDKNLTLSRDCERELNHSMPRPHPIWTMATGHKPSNNDRTAQRPQETFVDFWDALLFPGAHPPSSNVAIACYAHFPALVLLVLGPIIYQDHRFSLRNVVLVYLYYVATVFIGIWYPVCSRLLLAIHKVDEYFAFYYWEQVLYVLVAVRFASRLYRPYSFGLVKFMPTKDLPISKKLWILLQGNIELLPIGSVCVAAPTLSPLTWSAQNCIFKLMWSSPLNHLEIYIVLMIHSISVVGLVIQTRQLAEAQTFTVLQNQHYEGWPGFIPNG